MKILLFCLCIAVNFTQNEVNRDPIATTELFANQDLSISSKVSSIVQKIYKKPGEFIKMGTILIELDGKEAQARLQFAQGELKESELQLELAKVSAKEEDLEWSRLEELWKKQSTSKQELDKQGFRKQRAQLEVQRYLAQLEQKQAKVDELKAHLNEYQIKAPFDGTVLDDFRISVGQLVQVGDQLLRYADLSVMKARTYVAARFWKDLSLGLTMNLKFDGHAQQYQGTLTWISDFVHPQTRSKAVDITIKNVCEIERCQLVPGNFGVIFPANGAK